MVNGLASHRGAVARQLNAGSDAQRRPRWSATACVCQVAGGQRPGDSPRHGRRCGLIRTNGSRSVAARATCERRLRSARAVRKPRASGTRAAHECCPSSPEWRSSGAQGVEHPPSRHTTTAPQPTPSPLGTAGGDLGGHDFGALGTPCIETTSGVVAGSVTTAEHSQIVRSPKCGRWVRRTPLVMGLTAALFLYGCASLCCPMSAGCLDLAVRRWRPKSSPSGGGPGPIQGMGERTPHWSTVAQWRQAGTPGGSSSAPPAARGVGPTEVGVCASGRHRGSSGAARAPMGRRREHAGPSRVGMIVGRLALGGRCSPARCREPVRRCRCRTRAHTQ